jgi:histidine triad (HIT) family protein
MDCIFCKIVNGELKSSKVYEDEHTLAFLDISPVNYGHTLVIPKKHYENLEAIPDAELCEVIRTVKKVGLAIKKGLGVEGYNVQLNNDPAAGQVVPHIHFHITPRTKGDGLSLWPQGRYADGEAEEAMEKIKKYL